MKEGGILGMFFVILGDLAPGSITLLTWNLGLFSLPPSSLKADVNKLEWREEVEDQHLLEHVEMIIWEAG